MVILSIVLIVIKQRLNMVNMNKRMRLQCSSDEDYEPPASLPKASSDEASAVKKDRQDHEERGEKEKKNVRASVITPLMTTFSQKERASVIIPLMSTPGASVEKEDKEKKQKVRAEELKQKLDKVEAEKKKLTEELYTMRLALSTESHKVINAAEKIAKLERDLTQSRKAIEKALKERDEAANEAKDETTKIDNNVESNNLKNSNSELEKEELLNNLRELAETDLQCAVCSEVFLFACTLNCGHTFCHHCIHKWEKEKQRKKEYSNCPVCRTTIKEMVDDKTLDKIVDKMYGQIVSDNGWAARASLKQERLKLKSEWERIDREMAETLGRAKQWFERMRLEDEDIARFRDMQQFLYQLVHDKTYFRPELLNDYSAFVHPL